MRFGLAVFFGVLSVAPLGLGAEDLTVPLPSGVRAVWDLDKAVHETTPTRERICLNGLWQWQPSESASNQVPSGNWGWFKVPGCWPDIANLMEKPPVRILPTDVPPDRVLVKDSQTVFAHPNWKTQNLDNISAAWYQRKITVPGDWANRRIALKADYINSVAAVYVDGQQAGEMRWPGGDLDISTLCQPGSTHTISLFVRAVPLSAVMLSYGDTIGVRQVRGTVERRGLCGDVYLVGTPAGARLADVKVSTSVRKWAITFETSPQNLAADASYALRAQVSDHGRMVSEFTGPAFKASDLKDGRIAFTKGWKPKKLWDIDTPQNMYEVRLSLVDGAGKVLDAALPDRFGFRELWIDGKDFYLNGTRIFLRANSINNAQMGAAWANYEACKETIERIKGFGVNFVYTHNYGCTPGAHLSFSELLRAADDEGMLIALLQPHFGQYNWDSPGADLTNGYARHAQFYAQAAGNHPSVVFYATSHNSAGTSEMGNPNQIDGIRDEREARGNATVNKALRAEAIIKRLDPSRIVYHHSGANLGAVYTANFYANFVPMQEMSDWFEHWAAKGVKPVFFCEYGSPINWDWTMYRGWYQGRREYGTVAVPWDLCVAEWDAEFFGDQAYKLTDLEKESLRWEAERFRTGQLWHRWEYPGNAMGSPAIEQRNAVMAMYVTENSRAFRAWEISALYLNHDMCWKVRDGIERGRNQLKVDWDKLQRPGFSPDYIDAPKDRKMEWIGTSYERSDWIPTAAGQAVIRNNMPLLAYIAGKPSAFTSKDHNFYPGDTFEKQLIVINDSRRTVKGDCSWSLALPQPISSRKKVSVETGHQARLPLSFTLPAQTAPGRYELSATVKFSNGETQTDTFAIDVVSRPGALAAGSKIAIFDPKGESARLLHALGVQCAPVDANADLSAYDTLIVGKAALDMNGPAPDITRVRDGLKVVMFEQTSQVLEQRFGFRVEEQGLREVFKRVPDHPLLAGIVDENLRNWRGKATLLPPVLQYVTGKRYVPQVMWCDIPVKHLWRCGNRGNVASVIIEKPARGDFMPILDGGYSLQFSPLMEYREGKGMVLFCQMDVTGRTESDPTAERLTRNILEYVSAWKPAPNREVLYVGNPAGKKHLELTGITPVVYQGGKLSTDAVLVVGTGGGKDLAGHNTEVADFVKAGGHVLAVGLDEQEANAFLPLKVSMKNAEHLSAFFEPFGKDSLLAGVSPADVHNRVPRTMPLVSGGATGFGDGVLAKAQNANVVFCQFAPYDVCNEQAGVSKDEYNVRKTYRRSSYLMTRLLANLGGTGSTPILERFHQPVAKGKLEARWSDGLYLDAPIEWDDPYRFFCW